MLSIKEIEEHLLNLQKDGKIKGWTYFDDGFSGFNHIFLINIRDEDGTAFNQRVVFTPQDIDKKLEEALIRKDGEIS